jgi:hypothetical protein
MLSRPLKNVTFERANILTVALLECNLTNQAVYFYDNSAPPHTLAPRLAVFLFVTLYFIINKQKEGKKRRQDGPEECNAE